MKKTITLAHGSGGKATQELIRDVFLARFEANESNPMEDCALLTPGSDRLVFSTDSFVVDPIFFPGGNIGSLAIHGTINDLAMRGGQPLYLAVGMIIEEGFPYQELETIVSAMQQSCAAAGVAIVAGDTKVVPVGKADKIFINTSGIGVVDDGVNISAANGRPGDSIILSGTMADHGATILCQREGLAIQGDFHSDSAPLHHMVATMLATAPGGVRVLRDPTRGGVGTTLNELAIASDVGIKINEQLLPIRHDVRGACDLLGIDPLYLANEGSLLAFVAPKKATAILAAMQTDPHGVNACIIGEVVTDHPGRVVMQTAIGGSRVIDMLHGEPLPRIC